MDFLRPLNSRHVLAAVTVGLVAAAFGGACAAQDERGAMSQGGYQGPYLSWSGKRAPTPDAAPVSPAQDDAADLTEARYAPAPDYMPSGAGTQAARYVQQSGDASAGDASESRYAAASYAAAQPQAAPPPLAEPRFAAAAPVPAVAPQIAPAPQPAVAYVQPAGAPSQPAQAQPPQAQPAQGTTGVRFYSLHRAYGLSPDPDPAPTEGHTVLIAPDPGASAHDDGQVDQDGDGDGKPAAHGDGQSGDN